MNQIRMIKVFMACPSQQVAIHRYPYINRMAYYVCDVVERNSNSHPQKNVMALKAGVMYAVTNMFPAFI